MPELFEKYNAKWTVETTPLEVEMSAIRLGGRWKKKGGGECGNGLPFHYEQMRRILWPELDGEHNGQRWHVLCRDQMLNNRVTVLAGCASSGKTHSAAWLYLCDWLCQPEETCVLISSTDVRGLRLRVWGEITSLWERAVQRFDFLPGHLIDSRIAITFEEIDAEGGVDDRTIRDMRKAIIGIPTIQGGKAVGLGKWCGIKQKRVRLIADEAQSMNSTFLSAFANLSKNEDFRACILGNPSDLLDPLGKAAEPLDGWGGNMHPDKTTVWKTRFMEGTCVNLIGTDAPPLDFPNENRFKYLINQRKIDETASFFSRDSFEFMSQCVGAFQISSMARRVLSRKLCEDNHALESDVAWLDGNRTRIAGLDSAYNGDRCVFIWAEFGKAVGGKTILLLHEPMIIPIVMRGAEPEQQIAEFVKRECEANSIRPENFMHDSTGRGSLGTFLARVWSAQANPLEFGGQPTDRPVSLDHYVTDPMTKVRALITEKQHFSKRVSALWFAVRYCIEAQQLRGLTDETMEEGCMREWNRVANDKIELESKNDMKERMGRSPDLMDAACIVVEMARQRGFIVAKLANEDSRTQNTQWLDDLRRQNRAMMQAKELVQLVQV
jgi:hypothetical protein